MWPGGLTGPARLVMIVNASNRKALSSSTNLVTLNLFQGPFLLSHRRF